MALFALLLPAAAHSDRTAPGGAAFWVQTNGPQGGDGIAMASNAAGDVFVGTQGGGVFRSTDDGATWTAVNNGLTGTNVRALAINSSGDIFAGTFGGVFRSTDNGDTWVPVEQRDRDTVRHLAGDQRRAGRSSRARSRVAASIARPTTARAGRWSLDGLTNTYVTALAITPNGNIFAGHVRRRQSSARPTTATTGIRSIPG